MVNIIALVFLILLIMALYTVFYGAPFVVTDKKTIEKIIKLSGAKKDDKVVDLGSGDGRIVIEFAKRGIEAHGYEINPLLMLLSLIKAKVLGLENAHFHLQSFWETDLSDFNIVTIFGINYIMKRLEDKLEKELKSGTKVIALSYKFPNWKSERSVNGTFVYTK